MRWVAFFFFRELSFGYHFGLLGAGNMMTKDVCVDGDARMMVIASFPRDRTE